MYRYGFGRRRERFDGRRWRPRSRALGCLLWVVLLMVILVVLSLMFGGFQKGTKVSGLGPVSSSGTTAVQSASWS